MRQHDEELRVKCERVLSSLTKRGDLVSLKTKLGVSLSEVSQQVNPNESRPSDYYKCIQFLCEWSETNPTGARAAVAFLQTCVEARVAGRGEQNEAKLTGELAKESTDVIVAFVEEKSWQEKEKELMELLVKGGELAAVTLRKGSLIATGASPAMRQRKVG